MSSENGDLDGLREARWFAGKGRAVAHARVAAELAGGALHIADVAYADGGPAERYLLIADDARWTDVLRADDLELRVTDAALLEARGPEAIPSTDQSNTLVAIDDTL